MMYMATNFEEVRNMYRTHNSNRDLETNAFSLRVEGVNDPLWKQASGMWHGNR